MYLPSAMQADISRGMSRIDPFSERRCWAARTWPNRVEGRTISTTKGKTDTHLKKMGKYGRTTLTLERSHIRRLAVYFVPRTHRQLCSTLSGNRRIHANQEQVRTRGRQFRGILRTAYCSSQHAANLYNTRQNMHIDRYRLVFLS